eukprot:940098-Alexandrium_andersonii.AAC.1
MAVALRTKIAQHVRKHPAEYQGAFQPDTTASSEIEGGVAPTTWDEYLAAIKRPRRWADGLLLLHAAATNFKRRILAVSYTHLRAHETSAHL